MIRKIFCHIIFYYQKCTRLFFTPCCRFYPSCSSYAVESVNKYGMARGLPRAFWRILRCSPFSKGGYDPVK